MSDILILGASGYLGARLSYLLANEGNNITAVCYPNIPNDKEWCSLMKEVIVRDISSEIVIEEITNQSYDIAIHLVSLNHQDSNKPPNFVNSINVIRVWNILERFSKKETLRKFIYISTIQVYGRLLFKEITEEYIPAPQNAYGLTHLLAENICNYYNRETEINCINARLSNSYGSPFFQENNCWWLVVNDLCKTAFYKKRIQLLSDGSPQRDFIHSTDVFRAVTALVNTQEKNLENNTYHISSGKTLTILELAQIVKSVYRNRYNDILQVIIPNGLISVSEDKIIKVNKFIINNLKLKSLGFMPKTDLESGVTEIFAYLEKMNESKY